MMMALKIYYANNVIKLGIYSFIYMIIFIYIIKNFNSSTKVGDYESCNAENAANRCLICNADVKRLQKIVGSDSYCYC